MLERLVQTARSAKRISGTRLFIYFELVASLGLAAYAQHIIDDRGSYGDNWPLLSSFDAKLQSIYNAPQSIAYALPLFFLAAGLFIHSLSRLLPDQKTIVRREPDAEPIRRQLLGHLPPLKPSVLFVLAIGGWSYLIYQLAAGGNQASNWWLFWGSLTCAACAFLWADVRGNAFSFRSLRWHPAELAFVGIVTAFFVGLMVQDLTSWQYARIGDEGKFWEFGRNIAQGNHNYNYFSTLGPYGDHPLLSSVYRGMVMRLDGVSMFSWKLASTIAIAASLPPFYWLVRTTINTRAAIFSTAILASSHVLFAYAHTGYDNILAIFPAIVAFALYNGGIRSRSALLLFCSGVAAGLGFYTFYTARTAIIILALVTLFAGLGELRRGELIRWARSVPLPIAAGFVMAVMPIFAVHGWDVIDAMSRRSLWCCNDTETVLGVMIESVPRAFLAFNYHAANIHYVSGSLFDEISAVLALLGLAYALYRIREPGYRFILIWGVVAIVVTGVFHQHPLTELPSRMNYAVPPMAAFAGLALDRVILAFASASRSRRFELALSVVTFVVVIPAIFGFNAHRFWKVTPAVHQISATTVIYREATSDMCDVEGHRTVVFGLARGYQAVRSVFFWYDIEDKLPLVLQYEGPPDFYEELIASTRVSCVMFTDPDTDFAKPIIERYVQIQSSMGGASFMAADPSGRSRVMVLEWRNGSP